MTDEERRARVRERNQHYYYTHLEEQRARSREYAETHRAEHRERARQRRQKNPEAVRAQQAKQDQLSAKLRRVLAWARWADGCDRCGQRPHPSAMDSHHPDPTQKNFVVSRRIRPPQLVKIWPEFLECKTLCANCHRIVHYELRQEAA